MNRPPFPSSPPSQPSPYRYLGRGGGERPVRLQIIIALVAGLILVAVPLYLWRRPRLESIPNADAATSASASAAERPSPVIAFDAGPPSGITLSKWTSLRCENPGKSSKTPPERCDHLTYFEDSVARAIRENPSCAPPAKTQFTVSYVVDVDFRSKKLTLFAGKSSSMKREKLKDLIRCVKRAMPAPEWGTIPHQFTRYKVNVTATYPPSDSF